MNGIKTLSVMCALALSFSTPLSAVAELDALTTLTGASEATSGDGEQPPEMPEGEEPPEMAEGETPPEMPDGEQPPERPDGQPGDGFGGSETVTQGETANLIDADVTIEGESYVSTGDDENALRVDGAAVTLTGVTVSKDAGESSNTEDGDFYGMNAALLATNGAQLTIEDSTVTSDAQNGNGIFSYGEGTVVTANNTTVQTSADNSGGIQTAGGGTTYAYDMDIETQGNSSAAIRSDRGGGTVVVEGGSYATSGTGSPAVYSTADITVKDAVLSAANSEALVVEGQNTLSLENCAVSGCMAGTYQDSSENIHNIMIYQSMSGDADVGTAQFSATGGSITALTGDMFYITNTHCEIYLSDVTLQLANDTLMTISGNDASRGWGAAGANGGNAEVVFENQLADGAIVVDSISTLNLNLTGSTMFTGSINIVDNVEGGVAVEDNVSVTIEEGATWTLTADSTVSHLENNGTVDLNGFTLTVLDEAAA